MTTLNEYSLLEGDVSKASAYINLAQSWEFSKDIPEELQSRLALLQHLLFDCLLDIDHYRRCEQEGEYLYKKEKPTGSRYLLEWAAVHCIELQSVNIGPETRELLERVLANASVALQESDVQEAAHV